MAKTPELLTIGIAPEILERLKHSLRSTRITAISLDLEKLLDPIDPKPSVILASAPPSFSLSIELAQTLRGIYPDVPLFLCCSSSAGFERKDFIKNGFTDAFLMPVDQNSLERALNEAIVLAGAKDLKVYRPVKLLDLEADETLDFDATLFLPGNNKYVKICNSGDPIDSAILEKIKGKKITSLYVPSDQMKHFYQYSAKKLSKVNMNGGLSATEKTEKLSSSVRDLMSGMFSQETASFQSGQEVLKTCGEIVSSYIIQGADSDWFLRIQGIVGTFGDHYSHSSNVSTLAALFSLGTGIGKPENLALAGLLHDFGETHLSPDVQALEVEEMNTEQFELYKKHPEMSVNLIRQKKIVLPDIVTKMILQHHEFHNGTGFPQGCSGERICKEAQLLAFADEFDHLTKLKPGKPLVPPTEAVQILKRDTGKFDPDLMKSLLRLFQS